MTAPGNVTVTWVTTITEERTRAFTTQELDLARVNPSLLAAGDTAARDEVDCWLAEDEDTDGDKYYSHVTGREITSVAWPPGQAPEPPDTRAHRLAETIQESAGTDSGRAAEIAGSGREQTADAG